MSVSATNKNKTKTLHGLKGSFLPTAFHLQKEIGTRDGLKQTVMLCLIALTKNVSKWESR